MPPFNFMQLMPTTRNTASDTSVFAVTADIST